MNSVPRVLHDAESWNHRHDGDHAHTSEREGDGKVPVKVHWHDEPEDPYVRDVEDSWSDDEADMGDKPDVAALLLDAQVRTLALVEKAAAESLAEARTQEAAVPGNLRSSLEAFDDGERSGVAIGLRKATQIVEKFKATAVRRGDDDVVSVLDDIALALVNEVAP